MNPGRPPPSAAVQQHQMPAGHNTCPGQGGNGGASSHGGDDLSTGASGRSEWRRDEHGRFMHALELYGSGRTGDEWKKIAAYVGSRTIEEVRLHGRQYLQRLVQQLPPSPEATNARRYLSSTGNYHQLHRGIEIREGKEKRVAPQPGVPIGGSSALSAAALECAQSMSVQTPAQCYNQPLQHQHQARINALHRNGRRPKSWTFQEEKVFETALARWADNTTFSWEKIAAALPGKTAKDVHDRYDEMIGEIASIEAGQMPICENPTSSSLPSGSKAARPQRSTSTLSQRAIPPPPIEVPPRSVGKGELGRRKSVCLCYNLIGAVYFASLDGAVGVFPSGSSTRSRRGSASGISMLSPTFLDLLANEAESEEKPPLPALPLLSPGLTNLPSPLFSPTLLPSGSPGFFSPGNKKSAARGQQDKKLLSSGDTKMEDIDAGPTTSAGKRDDPRRSSTPRIWNDFLAEDFKFDDPIGTTPSNSSRKTPRVKTPTGFGEGTSTSKTPAGKQDVEMTDASAA